MLIRHIRRTLILACALACWCSGRAQGERGSLTQDFPEMSAKERGRIAAKEAEEAEKDGNYQEVMRTAELAFQEGRYEEAIRRYEEARAMRPYNVYPKVKIEDLQALLARQALKQDTAVVVEAFSAPSDPPVPARVAEPPPPPVRVEMHVPPSSTEAPPSKPSQVQPGEQATTPAQPVRSSGPADGIIERRYREGHAFVIERAVSVEGRVVKYKRVYHPYGQTFYFEDGLAVDERIWKARFPER